MLRYLLAPLLLLLSIPAAAAGSCYREVLVNGEPMRQFTGYRHCVEFDPPRVISGIWIDRFEGMSFHEGIGDLALARGRKNPPWLEMDEQTIRPSDFRSRPFAGMAGQAYVLTFVGRTAKDMNRKPMEGYGHFGMSPGLILVDRVINWQPLGPAGNVR